MNISVEYFWARDAIEGGTQSLTATVDGCDRIGLSVNIRGNNGDEYEKMLSELGRRIDRARKATNV